jgi:hypothetical protein
MFVAMNNRGLSLASDGKKPPQNTIAATMIVDHHHDPTIRLML